MVCEACGFETDRLRAREWHSASLDSEDLASAVVRLLTEPVTRSLPTSWRGSYTMERARDWIKRRDNEGTTLLVLEKSSGDPIGLMILFETAAESGADRLEVRIGYLLSEPAWGKGYASELLDKFVAWCREHEEIDSLAGGVERDNPASARVLERIGFQPVPEDGQVEQQDRLFRLMLPNEDMSQTRRVSERRRPSRTG